MAEMVNYALTPCIMLKRTLVLTTESARHPFRQTLPPHVFTLAPAGPGAKEVEGVKLRSVSADDSDWKLFLLSFVAFFTAFYGFIF